MLCFLLRLRAAMAAFLWCAVLWSSQVSAQDLASDGAGPGGFWVSTEGIVGDFLQAFHWGPDARAFRVFLIAPNGKVLHKSESFALEVEQGLKLQAALVPLDSLWQEGPYFLRWEDGLSERSYPVAVKSRTFRTEEIVLDRQLSTLRGAPNTQRDKESEEIWELYNRFDPGRVYERGPLSLPLDWSYRETAFFGDRRRYIYSSGKTETSVHSGWDLQAPKGTGVFASGDGRVVLAKERILTGKTVVLEHLPGLYSVYFHLDEIFTAVDRLVRRGEEIGTLGRTGFATAAHLHWEIRLGAVPIEPKTWLTKAVLDKDTIKAIIDFTQKKGR